MKAETVGILLRCGGALLACAALAVLAGLAPPNVAQALQMFALLVTASSIVFFAMTAIEAGKSTSIMATNLDEMRLANFVSLFMHVIDKLNAVDSRNARKRLFDSFCDDLIEAAKVLGLDASYVETKALLSGKTKEVLNVRRIMQGSFPVGEAEERELNRALGAKLDDAERILLDYDAIAIPYYYGLGSADFVADAYRNQLRTTAYALVPLVALKKRLREGWDPAYKVHYRHLMTGLGILDELGWSGALDEKQGWQRPGKAAVAL